MNFLKQCSFEDMTLFLREWQFTYGHNPSKSFFDHVLNPFSNDERARIDANAFLNLFHLSQIGLGLVTVQTLLTIRAAHRSIPSSCRAPIRATPTKQSTRRLARMLKSYQLVAPVSLCYRVVANYCFSLVIIIMLHSSVCWSCRLTSNFLRFVWPLRWSIRKKQADD